MRASHLIDQLQLVVDRHGDVEVLVDARGAIFNLVPAVDFDQFDPDGPHYAVLEAEGEEL